MMSRDENKTISAKKIPPLKRQNVGGAELPYLYYEGEDPQILFAHATGFLPWLWHPIIEHLTPHHEAWVPYMCNYRDCDPESGLGWDVIAKDIISLCVSQNIVNHLAVGHSMGATVLAIASALFGMQPRAMILIEPIFLPEEIYSINMKIKEHPLASQSIKRKSSWKDEKSALEYLKSKSLFAGWDEQMLAFYLQYGMEKQQAGDLKLSCSPRNEAALFMGGNSTNPWPLLKKLTCPVLIVEGEKSANKAFIDLPKAVSLLKDGRYLSVPDAGHLIPMQKPKEVAQIIKEFLVEVS
ncbi:MAG: alpha/beta hydrolase [Deltaproteobacteria bacterium HGW-Deltaproteobacteria-13]|jgi:pimeloyl-ACP methyl ester carboxylesterase|nr:MAG: alpha/beta hydrolase [Deltaproteobacteria bacterium HGW-Deltaproteobacteria-13]